MIKMKEGVYLKSKKWRFGAILLAMVILAGAVAGVSFANTDQTNNTTMEDIYQSFISKLAANLGVEESELTAALDATKQQMLEEAVEKGKITQEQADEISSNLNSGFCFGFGFLNGGQGPKGQGPEGHGRNLDGIASILGITADELKAEIESGKTIEEIVTEYGMTMDQVHEKMLELKKAEIAQAVTDGKLTQEQADQILERLEQGPKGQGFGGFGGRGLRGPGCNINDNSSDSE